MTDDLHPQHRTTIEPERRNDHGEPLCDECGMVVVDRENDAFGGSCLCQPCQRAYDRELEREFGGI